jgi:hypothetical protein
MESGLFCGYLAAAKKRCFPSGLSRSSITRTNGTSQTKDSLETAESEEYEVGVRQTPACEDVSPGAKERPLLDAVKTVKRYTTPRVTVICEVQSRSGVLRHPLGSAVRAPQGR